MAKRLAQIFLVAVAVFVIALSCISWWGERQRRKQKDTLANLRSIQFALNSRKAEHGAFPEVPGVPVSTLWPLLKPHLDHWRADDATPEDAWGNPILLLSSSSHFVLWSNGADGMVDSEHPGGARDGFMYDLIWTDEELWQWRVGPSGEPRPSNPESPFERVRRELAASTE